MMPPHLVNAASMSDVLLPRPQKNKNKWEQNKKVDNTNKIV